MWQHHVIPPAVGDERVGTMLLPLLLPNWMFSEDTEYVPPDWGRRWSGKLDKLAYPCRFPCPALISSLLAEVCSRSRPTRRPDPPPQHCSLSVEGSISFLFFGEWRTCSEAILGELATVLFVVVSTSILQTQQQQ